MRRLQVRFLLGSQRKWLKVGIKPLNQQNDLSYWRLPVIISYINKITKVGEKVKPSYSADTMRYGRNWVPKGIKNYWRVVLIRGTSFVVFLRCMPCKWFGEMAELVYRGSLENYWTERFRGFESLSLRKSFFVLWEKRSGAKWRVYLFPKNKLVELVRKLPIALRRGNSAHHCLK